MYVFLWVVLGALEGWVTGRVLKGNQYGPWVDIVMGIAGALGSGFLIQYGGFPGRFEIVSTVPSVILGGDCLDDAHGLRKRKKALRLKASEGHPRASRRRVEMREMIQAGTVLFRDGTALPDGLTFESEQFSPGWQSVKGLNGYATDRKAPAAGWTFFYLAGESRTTAFGREGQKTAFRAIKKILAGLKSEQCNSFEVTSVVLKTFLGMPYTTVSFHLRNLQKGMFLSKSQDSRPWKDVTFVAA